MSNEFIHELATFNPMQVALNTMAALRKARMDKLKLQQEPQAFQTAQGLSQAQTGLTQKQTQILPRKLDIESAMAQAKMLQAKNLAKNNALTQYLQAELLEQKVKNAQVSPASLSQQKEEGKKFSDKLNDLGTAGDVSTSMLSALDKLETSYNALPDSAIGPVMGHRGTLPGISSIPNIGVDAATRSNAQQVQAFTNTVVQKNLEKMKGVGSRINIPLIRIMQGSKPNIYQDRAAFNTTTQHWREGAKLSTIQNEFFHELNARGIPPRAIENLWANYLRQPNQPDWRKFVTPQAIEDATAGRELPTPHHLDISPHIIGNNVISQQGQQQQEFKSISESQIVKLSKELGISVEEAKQLFRSKGVK